ncbi:hypothetical protein PH505_bb00690 [Pseudoalteromonas distincta]|uniref:hypothetical protein n=1 Tax=Pseudoalteromonas distincta TaxID=77608 RepID=UPI00020A0FEC|nr:hypothetical protein [Pseudoalteromonas distincta]EGI72921.1 hypothetical protein PH505_bb00690 [Pseudoalteromonas distincta]
MSSILFPEGSQLSVFPIADGSEPIVTAGFDSIGGTIGSEGKLNADTVLSDLQAQYGKSDFKDAGERELLGRWDATDAGQIELKAAAADGKQRKFKLRVGTSGPTWDFEAVIGSFVMGELEPEKGLRFKAKMGINKDDGVA